MCRLPAVRQVLPDFDIAKLLAFAGTYTARPVCHDPDPVFESYHVVSAIDNPVGFAVVVICMHHFLARLQVLYLGGYIEMYPYHMHQLIDGVWFIRTHIEDLVVGFRYINAARNRDSNVV